jgi:rhodanese-related sulfurtransferase
MIRRLTTLALVVLLSWSLLSCSGSNQKTITVQQLAEAAAAGDDFYLIDVRTYPEFSTGHVAYADETIPYDSLQYRLADLPADKNATIYCFCRSGRRSGIATDFLTSQGYTNVYNVAGGIKAWEKAGYETVVGPLSAPASPNNSTPE